MTTTAAPPLRKGLLLALFTCAQFMVMVTAQMLGPLLVPVAQDLDSSVAVAGLLVAVTSLSWALIGPMGGTFSDLYGRRPILLIGIGLMCLGTLLAGLSWNMPSLAVFRLLTGAGGALVPPNLNATVGDTFPASERGKAVGTMLGLGQLGGAIGVPAVAVIAGLSDWRVPFHVVTVLLAVLFVAFLFLFPRGLQKSPRGTAFGARLAAPLRVSWVRSLFISNNMNRFTISVVTTYLAAFMVMRHGFSVAGTALPLLLVAIGLAAGSTIGGRVADKPWRTRAGTVAAIAAGSVGLVLFTLTPSPAFTIGAAFLFTLLTMVYSAINITSITEVRGEMRGAAAGMLAAFNQSGVLLGAALGGLVVGLGHFGWLGGLILLGAWVSALAAVHSARLKAGEGRQ